MSPACIVGLAAGPFATARRAARRGAHRPSNGGGPFSPRMVLPRRQTAPQGKLTWTSPYSSAARSSGVWANPSRPPSQLSEHPPIVGERHITIPRLVLDRRASKGLGGLPLSIPQGSASQGLGSSALPSNAPAPPPARAPVRACSLEQLNDLVARSSAACKASLSGTSAHQCSGIPVVPVVPMVPGPSPEGARPRGSGAAGGGPSWRSRGASRGSTSALCAAVEGLGLDRVSSGNPAPDAEPSSPRPATFAGVLTERRLLLQQGLAEGEGTSGRTAARVRSPVLPSPCAPAAPSTHGAVVNSNARMGHSGGARITSALGLSPGHHTMFACPCGDNAPHVPPRAVRAARPGGFRGRSGRGHLHVVNASWWEGLFRRGGGMEPPPEWRAWEGSDKDGDDNDEDSYKEVNGDGSRGGPGLSGGAGGPRRRAEPAGGSSQRGRGAEGEETYSSGEESGGGGGLGNAGSARREQPLPSWQKSQLVGGPFDDVEGIIDDPRRFREWQRVREVREATDEFLETGRGAPDDAPPYEDWLDDVEQFRDFSSWYEQEPDPWVKDGVPREAPRMPERGLSRTFSELLPLIFLPQDQVEEELTFEEKVFRFTSQATARFLLVLLLVPWLGSWFAHDCVFVPFTHRWAETTPLVSSMLDLRESQKLQLIQQLKLERQRIRFESEIGKAPPISEEQLATYLQEEAHHLRHEIRDENQEAFSYIFSDAVGLGLFWVVLYLNPRSVAVMKLTATRIFTNISDTGKAFVIILASDIFLGYHSQSGWETVIEMFLDHYGLEADPSGIFIFIATVPVTMDCFFKLWIFKGLTRQSPSLAATLKEMQRH